MTFENKTDEKYGIYYSRYIASWLKHIINRDLTFGKSFEDWLKSMGLNDEDIDNIKFIARNGKLELETSARRFLAEKNNTRTV